jgi:hypothetical protein
MSDAIMSFVPNADALKDAQKAVDAAKSPLPKAPSAPKVPSPTGGVTDQNNPGSLASPDFPRRRCRTARTPMRCSQTSRRRPPTCRR